MALPVFQCDRHGFIVPLMQHYQNVYCTPVARCGGVEEGVAYYSNNNIIMPGLIIRIARK